MSKISTNDVYTLKGVSLADGTVLNIVISGSTIASLGSESDGEIIDCTGLMALPGFVDLHTHLHSHTKRILQLAVLTQWIYLCWYYLYAIFAFCDNMTEILLAICKTV